MKTKIKAELIESFLVVWDFKKARKLYSLGFYGKPLGIRKPKSADFEAPLVLDLMEGLYLLEKGIITVVEKGKEIEMEELKDKARKIYEKFDMKYAVYKHLRESGLVVTPGIKYGCDFAAYIYGPGIDHAPYMISVKDMDDEITATEIVKAGRLATTVRKRFVISIPEKDRIVHLMFKWFKA